MTHPHHDPVRRTPRPTTAHHLAALGLALALLLGPGAGLAWADGPGQTVRTAQAEVLPRALRWAMGLLAALGVVVGFGAASLSLREPERHQGHLID